MFLKNNLKFQNLLYKQNFFKSGFNEKSEQIYLTSSFAFLDSYKSEFFFKNSNLYNIYTRFSNPNFLILQNKIKYLEFCDFCILLSSGMSSVICVLLCFLNPFNILLTSNNLFGTTLNFLLNILSKFNIISYFINYYLNLNYFLHILNFNLKCVYLETPSNPLMFIYNLKNISYICKKYFIYFIIDNTISTPILQNPVLHGIDIVLHSCTKFIDGQGRLLGGVIISSEFLLIKNLFSFIRVLGVNLSSFNSWILSKSLETLFIRIKKQYKNNFYLFYFLKNNYFILNILIPGCINYNSYKFIKYQQIYKKNILFSFDLKSFHLELKRIISWKLVNFLNFILIISNIGDIITILTIPAISTHNSVSYFEKKFFGIFESIIRISLGLEDFYNIYNDLILCFIVL